MCCDSVLERWPLFRYYYWFAFPAFVAKPAWEIGEEGWLDAQSQFPSEVVRHWNLLQILLWTVGQLASIHAALQTESPIFPYFLVRKSSGSAPFEIAPVLEYDTFFSNIPEDEVCYPTLDGTLLPNIALARRCLYWSFSTRSKPRMATPKSSDIS